MKPKKYESPADFKQAVEQRLRSGSKSGTDFVRRRQLLVFDRLLARVVQGMIRVAVWIPGESGADIVPAGTDTLVVRRIQGEEPLEYPAGLVDLAEAPQAEPETVEDSQERSIVEVTPEEHALEVRPQ